MHKRIIKLWSKLESFSGHKYPKEIKYILNICGFDSELSLKEIKEQTIESIEEIVNNNLSQNNSELIEALKDSSYEGKPLPFKFLLGHKLLILSIPQNINSIAKNKNRKKFENTQKDSEKIIKPDELKNLLLVRLADYARKQKLIFEIKEEHIKKFSKIEKIVRCAVKCCYCDAERTCTFVTFWEISNITKHLKGHPESRGERSVSSTPIERSCTNVLQEINNLTSELTTKNP